MSIERKPVAFGDLRGWIAALHAAGEIREIDAEVDWNIEIGTVMRLAQGTGDGPALMFNRIKDYGANARCRRIFGCGLSSYRRVAMMLGVPADTHPRDLVKLGRNVLSGAIPPKVVPTGTVKQNIVTGDAIDLYDLPSPWWNRLDGGRYLLTYGGCVTRDHDTGVMNVGIYRGMVASKNQIPILMWRAQHVGQHATSWERAGHKAMPIAVAIGWEPAFGFTGGAPVPKGVCEYDVMGAIRGAPVELVKCETVDLYVPASAEIVIEGYLELDPANYVMEGPFAEFTGYLAGDKLAEADHPGDRHHPSRRSDPARHHRGLAAGQLFGERDLLLDHARRDRMERAGARRRAGHHRRMVPAGPCRHQSADPDEAELSRPGQAGGGRDLGLVGRPCPLQAHHGRR